MNTPKFLYALLVLTILNIPIQADAEELFIGSSFNGVNTPFSAEIDEDGANIQIGIRGNPEKALQKIGAPSLYLFISINDGDDTDFIAGGLSWHINVVDNLYFRPGIGIALQGRTAERFRVSDGTRIDLGSAVLFEPELILGYEISDKVSVEATWQHISHATLFDSQNPGIDLIGARLALKF